MTDHIAFVNLRLLARGYVFVDVVCFRQGQDMDQVVQRSCPTGHIKAMKYMKGQKLLQLPYCAEHCRCESSYCQT